MINGDIIYESKTNSLTLKGYIEANRTKYMLDLLGEYALNKLVLDSLRLYKNVGLWAETTCFHSFRTHQLAYINPIDRGCINKLTEIELFENGLTDISNILPLFSSTSLKILKIVETKLTSASGVALITVLKNNTSLEMLMLNGIDLSAAVAAIIAVLPTLQSLSIFDIAYSKIADASNICAAISRHPSIVSVNIEGNGFCLRVIKNVIEYNKNLISFNIGSSIDDSITSDILARNIYSSVCFNSEFVIFLADEMFKRIGCDYRILIFLASCEIRFGEVWQSSMKECIVDSLEKEKWTHQTVFSDALNSRKAAVEYCLINRNNMQKSNAKACIERMIACNKTVESFII